MVEPGREESSCAVEAMIPPRECSIKRQLPKEMATSCYNDVLTCYTLKLKTRAFGNPTMLRLSLPYSHNLPAARYEEEKERIKGRNVYLLHDAGSQRVCYESLKEIGPLREPQEQDPARRTANHYRRSGYRRCRWSVFLG